MYDACIFIQPLQSKLTYRDKSRSKIKYGSDRDLGVEVPVNQRVQNLPGDETNPPKSLMPEE